MRRNVGCQDSAPSDIEMRYSPLSMQVLCRSAWITSERVSLLCSKLNLAAPYNQARAWLRAVENSLLDDLPSK